MTNELVSESDTFIIKQCLINHDKCETTVSNQTIHANFVKTEINLFASGSVVLVFVEWSIKNL